MRIATLISVLVLSACASAPLTSEEMQVRILRKSDAPKECKEIGRVLAPGFNSLTDDGREQDLKRATHKAGGNVVTWDKQDENNTVYGTAWKCPNA